MASPHLDRNVPAAAGASATIGAERSSASDDGRTVMMVPKSLTEEDLAASLSDVLEGVREGRRYLIERQGTVIGEIIPISEKPGFTVHDLAGELFYLPPFDDDFGADVRMGRMLHLPDEEPEWPD
jgi:antitoxin (DNA-binding transcriptional repressor) of toxin-antitoxin stability system